MVELMLMATAARRPRLKTFHFVVRLVGAGKLTRRLQDRVYEAGCDDAALIERNGQIILDFDRRAKSMPEAVESAISDLQRAGLRVSKVVFD